MTTELKELYEQKGKIVEEMEKTLSEVKKRGGKASKEEREKYDKWDDQLDELNEQIGFQIKVDKLGISKEAKEGVTIQRGATEKSEDNFSTPSGAEIPVFNIRSKGSVKETYERTNSVDDSLKGMTFGRLVRAHLFGAKNELEERALSEGTPSAGGYTVPEIISADFIDRLRPKSRVLQAGANLITIDNKTDKYSLAKLLTGLTVEWKAENAEQTPADPTFGQVSFEFKTLRAMTILSNELLQDSLNIERAITQEAVKSFAAEFDRVALVGTGMDNQPLGITGYSNAKTVSMVENGAAPTNYDEIIALISELQSANVDIDGNASAIMHPRTLASYNAAKSDVDSQPLNRPPYIQGMPFLQTTSVPITDTYGTSSAGSKLFLADWSQLYFGMRLGVTIIPLRERYAENYQTGFVIAARMDVQPYHEEAFGYVKGLIGSDLPS